MNSISPDTVEYDEDGLYKGAPARKFLDAISACFQEYATFSGRASRSEYWYFMLFSFILIGITGGIGLFVVFLPVIAVSVRRLHDTDKSGWWIGGWWLTAFILFFVVFITDAIIDNIYNQVIAQISVNITTPHELIDSIDQGFMLFLISGSIIANIPYFIYMLMFMCEKGSPKANKYG